MNETRTIPAVTATKAQPAPRFLPRTAPLWPAVLAAWIGSAPLPPVADLPAHGRPGEARSQA